MTNEEKIRAYDEALERAKEIMDNTCSSETTKITCQEIFPELTENAESEYERIRKAIIGHLKNDVDFVCNGITKDECLAWLEKQKDRLAPIYEDIDSFESALGKAWKDYNDSGARIVDGCEDDYVECAHAKGFREGYLFGVEKQKDASKAIEAVDRIDKYIDEHLANAHDMKDSNPDKKYYRGWDDALGKMAGILQDVYSEKKQKEQKPVDLVAELKLHLANTPKEQLEKEWKELEPYGNIGPTVHEFLYGEQPAEDWREERKKECPFRRKLDNNLYGCERYADVFCTCDGNCSWVVDYPKLKEIQDRKEQKPINESNMHEPTLDEARKWNEAYEKGYSLGYENGRNEQKPEWSEEDENMLNSCISSIEEAKENRYYYRETDGDTSYDHEISWLKSLRPSWKPTEEQMEALDYAITGDFDKIPPTSYLSRRLEEIEEYLKTL